MSHAALLISPVVVTDGGRAWHPYRTRRAALARGAIRRTNPLHLSAR
jgi:hypothetical protein